MRAVAVGLVLLFHAGLPFVPGGFVGVDVFFVISGFLITSQLVAEVRRRGTVSLSGFYARRAKRLLPAAGLVLVVTALLVRFLVPRTRWEEIGGDIAASALYVGNWRLAQRSVDYLAAASAPSPVQHFWSLAVEEQYYLVWPLLIILAAVIARRLRVRVGAALWAVLGVVVVPSFVWSVVATAKSPADAYFVTTTRMWELGVGAGVALGAAVWPRVPRTWAIGFGWLGVVAILVSAFVFSPTSAWPGYSAVLPTMGTALVIVAGFAVRRGGPEAILGLRPMRWIGGISYSLYLWHWPLVVVATAYWSELSPAMGLLVSTLAILPAWLTSRLIENPIRRARSVSSSPQLALSLGANFTVVGVAAGLVLVTLVGSAGDAAATGARVPQGAAVLRADPRDDPAGAPVNAVEWMVPLPSRATADVPDIYPRDCQQDKTKADIIACDYGAADGTTTVAVAGDSKVAQWMPALDVIAKLNGWKVVTYLKSACSLAMAMTIVDGKPYTSCRDWRDKVLTRLAAARPRYVITSQEVGVAVDSANARTVEAMAAGLRTTWSTLTKQGSQVIVIADNPPPGFEVYECVDKYPKALTKCAFSRDRDRDSGAPAQRRAADKLTGVHLVDLDDAICPTAKCAPVIGNVLVYRQSSHITATYAVTLTPRLATALQKTGIKAAYP